MSSSSRHFSANYEHVTKIRKQLLTFYEIISIISYKDTENVYSLELDEIEIWSSRRSFKL